jgi:argininosuccinate synthase
MKKTSEKKIRKVVLAYSGGLDTSVILPWLREKYDCEVIAFAADLGQGDELDGIKQKARRSGADVCVVRDLRQEFAEEFCFPMLRAGAVYEHSYLLGTSVARPLIAREQVRVAAEYGADAVAHGCTGKGNDQVRFELTYMALGKDLRIIAPWRDPQFDLRSREAALEYANARGIPVEASKKSIYSRDRNLWHISHEGADLEDPGNMPKDDLWVMSNPIGKAPDRPGTVVVEFEKGSPKSVDGVDMPGHKIIEKLNKLGGKHAVGQTDLVENRLVGIKSRGAYETPGGTILTVAHRALESICLDRDTSHYKQQIALKYAEMVYNGQWYHPLREALQAFVDSTQRRVAGSVKMKLFKGHALVASVDSPHSQYSESLASFVMGDEYDPLNATGFIRLFGLPMQAAALANGRRKSGKGRRLRPSKK